MNQRTKLIIIMVVGVLAMSSSSIMIRVAQAEGIPSVVIAAYRLTIATLVLTVPLVRQRAWEEYATLEWRSRILLLVSGVLLGLHFASWITSLEMTSVASSVVLVTTTPLWISLASPLLLGERNPPATWLGIAFAIIGGSIIGLQSAGSGDVLNLRGDALALLGAIFVAGYLMIGRGVRDQISLVSYLWVVYGSAALLLIGWAVASGYPLGGYSVIGFAALLGLGLIPQLIGHSAANYAMRHLSATLVSISILGEPIGATILAFVLLQEAPTAAQLAGGTLILGGIALASVMEERQKRQPIEAS